MIELWKIEYWGNDGYENHLFNGTYEEAKEHAFFNNHGHEDDVKITSFKLSELEKKGVIIW
jgi:hypothetical protein